MKSTEAIGRAPKHIDFPTPTPGSWGMISVSPSRLNAALVASATTHGFTIFGYQTAEQARAYFAGQTNPFEEIEDWLEFCLPDERSMSAIDDFHGSLRVAIPDVRDAVTFKLAWGDAILGS